MATRKLSESDQWFKSAAMSMRHGAGEDLKKKAGLFQMKDKPRIGTLLFFIYDAKYKDTLPVWDACPLVFPIQFDAKYMIGLNIHYLPPTVRLKVVKTILEIYRDEKNTNKRRDEKIAKVMKSVVSVKAFDKCFKKYLISHVQTKFMIVDREKWELAATLKLARWHMAQ